MPKTVTKDNLFAPSRSKAETKADITDSAARAIIEAERVRQDAKTARLREARLAMEAEAAAAEPTAQPKPRKRRTAGTR